MRGVVIDGAAGRLLVIIETVLQVGCHIFVDMSSDAHLHRMQFRETGEA